MFACFWLAYPQFGVLPSLPVNSQDYFTRLLIDVGDDIGNQGPHKLLARSHGYAGSIPCRSRFRQAR